MYRIMCNSLRNYEKDFEGNKSDARYRPVYFLQLIRDTREHARHKAESTKEYALLSHFLWHVRDCGRSEQILHELNMLGISGQCCLEDVDFTETYRIWLMLLQKVYWRD